MAGERVMIKRFPMGIPFGWFFVSYSDEIAVGEVKPLHYFGRDLVIFRGENGQVGVLDAYCPHLGAHLGKGGCVEGNSIRCPFHAWAFDAKGMCTDIPYAKAFPPRAKREPLAEAYPVTEANGVVWCWYHPAGEKPAFDVLHYEDFEGAAGFAPLVRRMWRFASNPQEIAENGVDVAHFEYVHRMDAVPEGKSTYDGHVRISEANGHRVVKLPTGEEKTIPSSVRTVQNGAGQKYTRLKGVVDLSLMVLATPVEADDVELRFCFTYPDSPEGSNAWKAAQAAIAGTCGQTGVEGDIPIWANKIHRAQPFLCDGDGPILRFRRYFEQFYSETLEPHRIAAE